MTEQEWLTSTNPIVMLDRLKRSDLWTSLAPPRGPISDRKLRLFACACCRQVWDLITDEWSRRAVIIAERNVDNLDSHERMMSMHAQSFRVPGSEIPGPLMAAAECCNHDAARAATQACQLAISTGAIKANLFRCIIGNPFRQARLPNIDFTAFMNAPRSSCDLCGYVATSVAEEEQHRARCHRWLTPLVHAIAQDAYDNRNWDALPILADALEEAGCHGEVTCPTCKGTGSVTFWIADGVCPDCPTTVYESEGGYWRGSGVVPNPILSHLRGPGPHVRGCHAIDLILGKE